ncbi:MAG: hypothetical protein WKF90_10355 [Pyrinomonadaceae bacterium]
MMGHHFGVPHHKELQRRIILAMLDFLTAATRSGEIKMLPLKWATARREAIKIERKLGLKED